MIHKNQFYHGSIIKDLNPFSNESENDYQILLETYCDKRIEEKILAFYFYFVLLILQILELTR